MNYSYAVELTTFELGRRYINLGPDLVHYLDNIILYGNSKIATIKYLRASLNISLSLAKILFEARKDFLSTTQNPYGWVK